MLGLMVERLPSTLQSGEYHLIVDGEEKIDVIMHPGDTYAIPGNTHHSFEVIEGGEVIDVFTPHREDYL